jgi:hypothetical protein
MANTFNPLDAVKAIFDDKAQWQEAYKKGDKNKADEVAKHAQNYYKQLIDSGYTDVAKAMEGASTMENAKYILDNFAKSLNPTTPTTPNVDTSSITGKINHVFGRQDSNMETMTKKYDTLENYIYSNPYESEEAKSIMANYKFQGKKASDNAVASGGASNGGNIDSYASANANRQQLAFTNAGNQVVLDNFNSRINNIRGALSDMGVYLQNQEKGMQDTIGLQRTEEQRVFENDETSKNNDVSRKKTVSEVTGFAPNEWVDANNPFLDENGKLKPEYENIDFSVVIDNAKKNGNTELYNQAMVARGKKIYGNYEKYGKYDDGNYTLNGAQQTEAGRQFDKSAELTDKELDNTKELTQAEIEANERNNKRDNTTKLTVAQMDALAKEAQESETFDDVVYALKLDDKDYGAKQFLNTVIKPYWNSDGNYKIVETASKINKDENGNIVSYGTNGDELPLRTLLEENKSSITKDGASKILLLFDDYDEAWVNGIEWKQTGEGYVPPQ